MDTLRSLTRAEAQTRAQLLSVERYDLAVDLTGMLEGDEFRAVATVSFTCREPGARTFVDCAAEVVSATLNGHPVGADAIADARIVLDDLPAENVLVVESVQRQTGQATAIHRAVDASDKLVYVWTSFEPDEARRAWACFDQPDLKAVHGITVTAPEQWIVLSNTGEATVEDTATGRRWTFRDTPPLSTYVPVVNAGPFHERRAEHGDHDLGLYARQSLASCLDRDADELFALTATGLAYFGERFGMPFPQRRYDQVWVPDMGGAMENFGCVTWGDSLMFRSVPTHAQRELRASVLMHEMAHMWFGDIVTMRWWDDLWLNEAFAEWAANWAVVASTEHTDAWASFLTGAKVNAYRADRASTTHPIRQPVNDVAEAMAGFDHITYSKGASVLKQLVAYVGEDDFVAGLRNYFQRHAWANASLGDLVAELEATSGLDLGGWVHGWLETSGTDDLTLSADGGGHTLRATGPGGTAPRPHRLGVGYYDSDGDTLVRRTLESVTLESDTVGLPALDPAADLVLVNDEDLTFAAVQPDDATVAQLLASATRLPTALSRAIAVHSLWETLATGRLSAGEFVECVTGVLAREHADAVIEPFLALAVQAAGLWSSDERRDDLLSSVADTCLELAERDGPVRRAATRSLASTAVTRAQLDALDRLAGDDLDLRWRSLTRLAALGRFDRHEVDALLERDPDPDAWVRALGVEAAQPDPEAKEAAWRAAVDERRVPSGSLGALAAAFWQPGQAQVLAPFVDRYTRALPDIGRTGMVAAITVSSTMFPVVGADRAGLTRLTDAASSDEVTPLVRRIVIERSEQVGHMLDARAR